MESSSSEEEEEEEMQQENGGGDDHDEINYIQLLIGNEVNNARLNDQQAADIMNDIWIQEIRRHAIHYILRITGPQFGFHVQTLYTAVTYVDRFLLERIVEVGQYRMVRLISVACLSLAAKMDESRENVPPLSHYPVGTFGINVDHIRKMELMILGDFRWDMRYVTPFNFIRFFLSRFARDVPSRYLTRMRIYEIVLSVLQGGRLMNHRPSVIAAAATLLAVNGNLTIEQVEIQINALPLNGLLQINNVWYCYNRLRQLNEHV
ncbi:hypothetical protein BC332_11850 [Capsicum chinense]|nr:hypothetical protein BC332_11850 [Capsicum chinense]